MNTRIAGWTGFALGAGITALSEAANPGWNQPTPLWEKAFWGGLLVSAALMGMRWPGRAWTVAATMVLGVALAAPLAAAENDDGLWLVIYFTIPVFLPVLWLCANAGAWTRGIFARR